MVMKRTETTSLCPLCLLTIPAFRTMEDQKIYLEKRCPVHGAFRTLLWSEAENYDAWAQGSEHAAVFHPEGKTSGNCPHECGLCADHEGEVCTAVFHLLDDCNLGCPVCFASSVPEQRKKTASLEDIGGMYRACLRQKVLPSIQLSGGEATLRDDLPQIIEMGKKMGFRHIQVNTNGLRLAQESEYLFSLKEAGADLIYLQFDGVSDDVYSALRGREILEVKLEALSNCRKAGIGVLLVPTVYPGINDHQLGEIVAFAKKWMPTVKGIHFQPVTYFGRFPDITPFGEERLTLPEVIKLLEVQTSGEIAHNAIVPRRKFDAHCSFSSLFMLGRSGHLYPITRRNDLSSPKSEYPDSDRFAAESIEFTNKFWRSRSDSACDCCSPSMTLSNWLFNYSLSITGMHFQDAWNIDLERLKGCCVFVATPQEQLIPFCAYYMTGSNGQRIYGGRVDA
jgi:7,8-dihydro-6-hydroxymethylpterin dimethyltransferase